MKRVAFRIVAIAVGVAIVAIGLELVANVYLYVRDRRYVPARVRLESLTNTFTASVTSRGVGCRYIDTLYPHPYLGFVHHGNPPCGSPQVNNIGLFGPDYPSERPADRFVVLVTGGSVAAQLMTAGAGHVPYLQSALQRDYTSPTGKPFLLLNGGDGGWHQPEQLILFLLYADAVHAVVTLDGYNERYFVGSSVRFEYPPNNFEDVNPLLRTSYSNIVKKWIAGKLLARAVANPVLSRSEAAYLVLARVDAYVKAQQSIYDQRERTNINTMFLLPKDWDDEHRFAWATGQYRKYIGAMDAVAAQHDVLAAHFLQPVPAIAKPLTTEEQAVVGPLDYRANYQRIVTDVMTLADRGTPVFSLLDVFAQSNQTLYADVIHLRQEPDGTSEGYRLMAERMAAILGETWQLQRKHPHSSR
jgi:hypothetical protein